MSREFAERILYGLVGAAVGAAAQGVPWTFWAAWAIAWGTVWLISRWHRSTNGGPASA